MKIALIGYGKMGKAIEQIALSRGHQITAIIDMNNPETFDSPEFLSSDVAIEFSMPDAAFDNYQKCFSRHIPVVAGTTGWLAHMDEIKSACQHDNQTFFYASNYSIGVNIFFELNKRLAHIMNSYPSYTISMKEVHHIHKLDAPSGTAITLAEGAIEQLNHIDQWTLGQATSKHQLSIEAERIGEVPGYHEVKYDSDVDTITIAHNAKSRQGFALGAVVAAEFVQGKSGYLTMTDLMQF